MARRLGVSVSTVRRLEGDSLHTVLGEDGVHRFDPDEVERVASRRSARGQDRNGSTKPPMPSPDGDLAAAAFEAFERGLDPRKAVVTLRQPPHLVSNLYADWLRLGGGFAVTVELRKKLEAVMGARLDDGRALVAAVEQLAMLATERRAFTYRCSGCGKMIQADPDLEWKGALDPKGRFGAWGHSECVDGGK